MSMLLAVLAQAIVFAAAGAAVLALAAPRRARLPPEQWIPLAFVLGWAAHTMLMMATLLVADRVFPLATIAAMAVAGAALLAHGIRLRRGALSMRSPLWSALSSPGAPWGPVLLLSAAAGLLVLLFLYAANLPLYSWDGRMIWNLKARLLFHEGTIFADSWLDPLRTHFHPDYPLMLPMAWTGQFALMGAECERTPRVFLAAMWGVFLLCFFDAARRRAGTTLAALGVLLCALAAFRVDYGPEDGPTLLTGVADLPLAFVAFVAFDLALRAWTTRERRTLLCSGMLIGATVLMKAEGIVVAAAWAVMNAGLWISAKRQGRRPLSWGSLGSAAAAAAIVAAPWKLLKARIPNHYDEVFSELLSPTYLAVLLERIPLVLGRILEEMLSTGRWSLFWPAAILVVLAAFAAGPKPPLRHLDAALLAWLGAYILAYVLSPLHLGYHIDTSIGRLLSQFQPLLLLSVLAKLRWMARLDAARRWRLAQAPPP